METMIEKAIKGYKKGNPCYSQLTPVKTRYPLTSIT